MCRAQLARSEKILQVQPEVKKILGCRNNLSDPTRQYDRCVMHFWQTSVFPLKHHFTNAHVSYTYFITYLIVVKGLLTIFDAQICPCVVSDVTFGGNVSKIIVKANMLLLPHSFRYLVYCPLVFILYYSIVLIILLVFNTGFVLFQFCIVCIQESYLSLQQFLPIILHEQLNLQITKILISRLHVVLQVSDLKLILNCPFPNVRKKIREKESNISDW